jgi:hypothetical protein
MAESNDRFLQTVRAVAAGDEPPDFTTAERSARREAVKARPTAAIVDQLEGRLNAIFDILEPAPEDVLARTVVVPAGHLSLTQVAETRLTEATLHSWDIHTAWETSPTLDSRSAELILPAVLANAPRMARRAKLAGQNWTFDLEMSGPGGGPATIEVRDDAVVVRREAPERADAVVYLPVEAAIRLLWGRLDLPRAVEAGAVRAEGDAAALRTLAELFRD